MNSNEHVLHLTPGVPIDAHYDTPRTLPGLADTLDAPLFAGQSLAPERADSRRTAATSSYISRTATWSSTASAT